MLSEGKQYTHHQNDADFQNYHNFFMFSPSKTSNHIWIYVCTYLFENLDE